VDGHEHYRDLAGQLAAMPGGVGNLREAFFGAQTLAEQGGAWALAAGGWLVLDSAERLLWRREGGEEMLLAYPPGLLAAAREFAVPPLGLALLVQAMGSVDDGGRLKRLLPDLSRAAKGLLLIAACRLCG
jgi:hypothetical protein